MATLLLSAVGTMIAGPFGGIAGALAGRSVDAYLFGSHSSRTVEGARLSDLSVQTASYGEAVPLVFGTMRLSGNLIWSAGLSETRHEDSETVGGKGSSQTVTTVSYTYSASFAVGLSARQVSSIGRIWADGKLLRDAGGQVATGGKVRLYTGLADQDPDPLLEAEDGLDNATAFRGLAYVMFEDLELAEYANRIPNLTFEIIADEGGTLPLAKLVEEVCELAGLSQVEATGLDGEVNGYVLSGQFRPRDVLEDLAELYDFDMVEQDGVLICRSLGRDVEEEITGEVLLRTESGEGQAPLQIVRAQELDLPREIAVSYLDSGRDYQTGLQRAFRQTGRSEVAEQKFAPLVLTSVEAKTQAEALLDNRWRRREKLSFDLPPGYCHLSPGDVVHLSRGNSNYTVMILETELSGQGLHCLAVRDGESLPVREVAAETGGFPGQQIVPLADSRLLLVDVPALDDEEQQAVCLLAAVNADAAGYWPGAALYLSRDGSGSPDKLASSAMPAVTGVTENKLAPGPACFPDQASRLLVRLDHAADVLENRTWPDVLNGANLAIIGGEVIQFTSASLMEPGLYELSGLLRGRRGTEDRIAGHEIGAPFILVSRTSLVPLQLLLSDMGQELSFGARTFGQSLEDIQYQVRTVEGRSLKPFSPVHVRGTRDSLGNLDINWIRRSRFGGAWRDGQDVPLGEAFEKYAVEILKNGDVIRTLECGDPRVIYEAGQQLADFGEIPAEISTRIYQISDKAGRGIPAEATL
ncbi:phage tail protein [Emcibacter nanhaiensis]|uniref:Uncharacterized protein n=1 Tax=Emcibacter nanhaiensis TaxID=1505037 RepID=A0A501PBY8_9PROT|nr:phage tail protein [Emcibacter nanhaiensis]TPD57735.1 hypothetical protein FIV46_16670 [Emcibacter nanhaiensis]